MMERSDAALLEDWSAGASEEAFAVLARRYGGLLYHAGMRQTGREDLAGEAAQNSLLILARKASGLGKLPCLAGWLHRTACYEAAKLLRRERRHEARMKRYQIHSEADATGADWKEAAPLLDRALDALPEKDRQVIFLKYFDGLSFEQMARQFGGEPAAWRQRGSRAVEKLRISLAKRGVAVSSSALATGLGTTLSQAAPASVIATLSTSSAAGAAAVTWQSLTLHSLHLMKLHPGTWIVAALILSAIPLAMQAASNSASRKRVELLENALPAALSRPSAAARKSLPLTSANTRKTSLLALTDQIVAGMKGDRIAYAESQRRIRSLSREELEELLKDTLSLELHPDKRNRVITRLFQQYVFSYSPTVPVEEVMQLAATLSDQLGMKGQEEVWGTAATRVARWAREDPGKAVAWYRAEVKYGRLDAAKLAGQFVGGIYNGLNNTNPEEAAAFYRSLGDLERTSVIHRWSGSGSPEEFLDLATQIADSGQRKAALLPMFQYATKGKSPEEVLQWLAQTGASGDDAVELLASAAEGDPYREDGGVRFYSGMKAEQIAGRIEWLRDPGFGENSPAAIGTFLASTMASSAEATKRSLDAEWESNTDEQMLAAYISRAGSSEAGFVDALQRSHLLSDPTARSEALAHLVQNRPAQEILALANKAGLSGPEIHELLPQAP